VYTKRVVETIVFSSSCSFFLSTGNRFLSTKYLSIDFLFLSFSFLFSSASYYPLPSSPLKEEKQSHSDKFFFKNTPTFFSTFTNDSFRKLDLNSKAYYFLTVVVVVVAPFFLGGGPYSRDVFVGNASARRIF
jgi:hypothetical protein